MTNKSRKLTTQTVNSFMANVLKTDMSVHRRSTHEILGTVTLRKSASESKSGKRVYSLSNSKIAKSGSYSAAGLRRAFMNAI